MTRLIRCVSPFNYIILYKQLVPIHLCECEDKCEWMVWREKMIKDGKKWCADRKWAFYEAGR